MEAKRRNRSSTCLRDLGGLIINDFIDMRDNKNKRAVERTFRDAVARIELVAELAESANLESLK